MRRPSKTTLAAPAAMLLALVVAGCGSTKPHGDTAKSGGGDGKAGPTATRAEFTLFAFGRVLGTIAPCGCTTEPLGGVQYAFGYMGEAAGDARVVVEPGSFLFPEPGGSEWPADEAGWEQARDRAKLLSARFGALGTSLVSGLGPSDLAAPGGAGALSAFPLPRTAANVTLPEGAGTIDPHRVVSLTSNGVTWKVGVTAVVDPKLPGADKLGTVVPAAPALVAQVEAMKGAGATAIVAMAHGERPFAESLAREVDGLDFVVVGVVDGVDRERLGTPPALIDGTYILEPGSQLQSITTVKLSVDAKKGVPALSSWTVVPPASALEEELARVGERLEKFKADASADESFVARLQAERDKLQSQLAERKAGGPPDGDAVAVIEQVKVTCKRPVDEGAKAALAAYDKRVAQQNKARFAGVEPPPAPKGAASYTGGEACADCHDEAAEFWETTVHASAYQTLVDDNKQFDLTCVGCHVTGFRKPGGSEVVENAGLVDVQCEVCHGPGSLHVDDGGEDLKFIELEAPESLCATQCHTPEHSDTFAYEAYLRDILGPGHGDAKRNLLGDGPTGHDLRQAGLKKAGGSCKKM
jgi:hypothetical protein